MNQLHPAFTTTPLAHRAFHDLKAGRPENSLSAIRAAVERGYGIEIDVQMTADHRAVVFHDYKLKRLTGQKGTIQNLSFDEALGTPLLGNDETIPALDQVLDLVAGKVPLLVEIKDQDGKMGPNVGPLENALAKELAGYAGPLAVMSFNPHSVGEFANVAPSFARGLVTSAWSVADEPQVPAKRRAELRAIPDFDKVGASFISHDHKDLKRARVSELKNVGAAVLCWTVKSEKAEKKAREVADNITFEGYEAGLPAT
jgi:glycerophosphoryl diester phosphodiesterase